MTRPNEPQPPEPAATVALPVTDSQMGNLLAAGAGVFSSQSPEGSANWVPPSVAALQQALPGYEISTFIARGGMGAVYKGRQLALHREVAIKVLPPGSKEDSDNQFRTRFKQEARAMARLSHPNIVTVFDAGETPDGLLYLVMEHIEGADLGHHIATKGRLDPAQAGQIIMAVCDALAFAHVEGVIHRDIKPSNIMLDGRGHAKVADFGLAKVPDLDHSLLTRSDMTLGTPDYIAPEALVSGGKVDSRADIYATGVMLYQMLTGQIPRGRFDAASSIVSGLDPRFDAIVDKAMQTDPDKRYGSAAEMRRALETVFTTPQARQDTADRSEPASRGNRRSLAVGLASALLITAGTAAWLIRNPSPSVAAAKTPPVRPPRPSEATRDAPFVNSLGMKFVPVPGTKVLFCIHETRYRDYAAFAGENPGIELAKKSEDHPAWKVRWGDARQFCEWLSRKEGKTYRLPTGNEWSLAAGLELKKQRSPGDTSTSLSGRIHEYPWGQALPPPAGAGNFSDQSRRQANLPGSNPAQPFLENYDDGFPGTAPVMSFTPNEFGLHDMAGNVWEWVEDWADGKQHLRILRGGSFADRPQFLTYRYGYDPDKYYEGIGFRVVLVMEAADSRNSLSPAQSVPVSPAEATRDAPFVNSLGMKFVPVPGTAVLFCIHETRWRDYAAFAGENSGINGAWRSQNLDGVEITERAGDHPVCNVSWEDSMQFCTWLSRKEGKTYRLPTDEEWSLAVGLGEHEVRLRNDTPQSLNLKAQGIYPWGTTWPPPPNSGNYHEQSSIKAMVPGGGVDKSFSSLKDYDDGFPTTAPVMSFAPNELGLYDLGGNVWEFVEDWYNEKQERRAKRGGSWVDSASYVLLSSHRFLQAPTERYRANGFRIVLAPPVSPLPK